MSSKYLVYLFTVDDMRYASHVLPLARHLSANAATIAVLIGTGLSQDHDAVLVFLLILVTLDSKVTGAPRVDFEALDSNVLHRRPQKASLEELTMERSI